MKPPASRSDVPAEGTTPGARRFSPRRDMLALESRIVFDGAAAAGVHADLAQLHDGAPHDLIHRLPDAAPDQRLLHETRPGF